MENLYQSSEEYSHIKNALFALAVDIFTKNKKNFDLSETEAYIAYSHEESFVKNLLKDVITKFKRSQSIAVAVKEDGFENTKAFANKINFRGFSADPFQDLEKNELINGIIKMAWFYVFAPSQFDVQKNMLSKKSTESEANKKKKNDSGVKKDFGKSWDFNDYIDNSNEDNDEEDFDDDEDEENDEARLTVIDENGNEIKTENNKSNSNIKNLLEKLLARIIKYCDDNSIVISSTTDDNVVMEFDDDFCTTDLPSNGKNVWCIYKNGSVSIDGVVKDLSSLNENDIAKIYYMIVANISCDDDIYEKCVTGADKKVIFTLGQQFNPSHYKDNTAYNKQMLRNAAKLPKCKTESMNKVIELIYEHYGFTRMELYWEISLKQHYLTVRDIYYNPIIYIYKDTPNLIYVGNYMQNTPIDMNNPGWEKKLIIELDSIRKREKQIDQERENNGFNDALRKAGLYDILH